MKKLSYLKNRIKSTVSQLGYEIRRIPTSQTRIELTHFQCCLNLLMGTSDYLNIVQIGANDGAINDPLFSFVSQYSKRTRVVLVEPQSQLIPYLEENYKFHGAKFIFNGALGNQSELRLFRVREEYWKDLVVPYAADWPVYRAPTGVTSAEYPHVSAWLSEHYKGQLPISDLIEEVTVEAVDMEQLLARARLFDTIDILQVDTEGFDDQVLYASDIPKYRPKIIHFELTHLSVEKALRLNGFLVDQGYVVSSHGIDGLAIRTLP
ncbi:FkbM family methyltransferase [Roseobacter sp. AzwK-3b]|uniref:FkbM family methyltransferase n=1 Tax=Roseobacter sp. AzwK-3b TaxID=351016 RepID=UPI000A04BB7F|nr:FkbM family methyltransferase [Roseobacter sp. AzwK-3b]